MDPIRTVRHKSTKTHTEHKRSRNAALSAKGKEIIDTKPVGWETSSREFAKLLGVVNHARADIWDARMVLREHDSMNSARENHRYYFVKVK